MATTLDDMLSRLPPARRARIEARASELIAEEMSLRALRSARQLTQEDMATLLGIEQATVSRLEHRRDMMISTLRKAIRAMGGELDLIVRFPGKRAVRLGGLGPRARQGKSAPRPFKARRKGPKTHPISPP
ncbi:MAG: helix-turn-helix transcriptional regulator [Alphaproteobacteria bacterium]|nr:helix-turn-helix transcriptional regulator [Alphaproteobacteria bacterium]